MSKRLTPEQAVVFGSKVKATLAQIETQNPGLVRLDWLRFSVPLDALREECESIPFDVDAVALMDRRSRETVRDARKAGAEHDALDSAMQVCKAGAAFIAQMLGGVLDVGPTDERGMDYYSVRTALQYAGEVVGWVLAGGKSQAQASTVHFNLFGAATLNIPVSVYPALRSWLEASRGTITRVDLALDVWQGLDVGELPDLWRNGAFDVRGKRPNSTTAGQWPAGHSRTLNVGSRASGKLCRIYEKGDQLFGHEHGDKWVRIEVEYRSACRVIDYGVLDRPGDYFAGAYEWTAKQLEAASAEFEARKLSMTVGAEALKDKTAEAAVTRVARWIKRTAAPAIATFLKHEHDAFFDLIEEQQTRVVGRLKGFDSAEIRRAFARVSDLMKPTDLTDVRRAFEMAAAQVAPSLTPA